MKLVKILTIPAVLLLSVALAAPAFANELTVDAKLTCTSSTQVCYTLTVTTANFPDQGRDFMLTLLGHTKGDSDAKHFVQIGTPQPLHLAQDLTDKTLDHPICFPNVTTTAFDKFELQVQAVGGGISINDDDTTVTLGPDANTCPPPPSPPQSPSPSPSMQTVATLASTGGLDLRLPLIGLTVIVAGLALYLVSAGRGRPSTGR